MTQAHLTASTIAYVPTDESHEKGTEITPDHVTKKRTSINRAPTHQNDSQESYSMQHHVPYDSQWASGNQARHPQQAGSPGTPESPPVCGDSWSPVYVNFEDHARPILPVEVSLITYLSTPPWGRRRMNRKLEGEMYDID